MFAASTVTAMATPTEESIKAKEAQISEAKKERDGLKSAKTDLEKVKKELLGSDNQLRIANNKVDEISIKKLTKDNPTMKEKFEALKK